MIKTKRFLCVLLTALMLLGVSGCNSSASANTTETHTLEEKVFPVRQYSFITGDLKDLEMSLYFVNGGEVPYVKVSDYLNSFGAFFTYEQEDSPAITYTYESPSNTFFTAKRNDINYDMMLNAEKDTIEFTDFNAFVKPPGDPLLISIVTLGEDGRGGSSNLFYDSGSYNRYGDYLTFDMKEYDIDVIVQNGEGYLPLQTMNDMLLNRVYILCIYTGKEVLIVPYGSDLVNEKYTVETGEMSEEYAYFNYNELRFLLDQFYGLKPEHNISDMGTFFWSTDLLFGLQSTDPKEFDRSLKRLLIKYFDDLHSSYSTSSVLSGKVTTDLSDEATMVEEASDFGASTDAGTFAGFGYMIDRSNYYPELNPLSSDFSRVFMYEEVEDTAIITFDSFSVFKEDYYNNADLENPSDTIELICYANKMIKREDSPIKNVVIDLTCNGGGNADAAAFLIAWVRGFTNLAVKDTLTGAQTYASYMADVNLDGTFDEDTDSIIYDGMNIYVLVSKASFSCGNLVPACLKDDKNVLIMGRTSGGGSNVVLPCTSASGATFQISGPLQLSFIRNGSFYNIDQGVEPDVLLNKSESFYDRTKLVDIIHNLD